MTLNIRKLFGTAYSSGLYQLTFIIFIGPATPRSTKNTNASSFIRSYNSTRNCPIPTYHGARSRRRWRF
jgi:hypothetical protein